jgi:triosephosphate isomerase
MPRTILAANWKMHKTCAETRSFFETFLPLVSTLPQDAEIVVAPPFTALAAAHDALRDSNAVSLGAQTMHWEMQGPFTGEISAPMLLEHGVRYVILGHSERRMYNGELDRTVNLKVKTALQMGLVPIVAVGETLAEREAGHTDIRVTTQTRAALDGLNDSQIGRVVLAYEPIWAIGTGNNCDAPEADRVMSVIRDCIGALRDVPILYGGSMKPENVALYMEQPNINGGLIGGASLDPLGFAELIRNARGTR